MNFLRASRDSFAHLRRPSGVAANTHQNARIVESVRPAPRTAGPRAVAAPDRFARLRGARRVWAVASVHGEARRLARLHDLIGARFAQGDRLVYLGNYLGHGEDVRATIDELLDFRRRVLGRPHGFACDVVYLRGAQEEMWQKLLQLQFAPNPGEVLALMVRAGVEATVLRLWRRSAPGLRGGARRAAHDHPLDQRAARGDERGRGPFDAVRGAAP